MSDFDSLDNDNAFDAAAASGFAPTPSAGLFDLTDVKADASGNPPAMPAGLYNCVVEDVKWGKSQNSGALMLTWRFKVINGEHASRTVMDWVILVDKAGKRDPRGMAKLKAYMQVVTPDYDLTAFDPDAYANSRSALNALCVLKLKLSKQNGEDRNNVIDVLPYNEDADLGGESAGMNDGLDLL